MYCVKTITTVLLVMLMGAGCREETTSVCRAQVDSSARRKSDGRVSAIEQEMAKMPQKLAGDGWETMFWGSDLIKGIMELDDRDERIRLTKRYLNSVTKLAPYLNLQHNVPLAFCNYEELIGASTIFKDEPEVAERILVIMCDCIRLHRHEVEKWAEAINNEPDHRKRVQKKNVHGCLSSYFMVFTNRIERTYFPRMKSYGLSAGRHEIWRQRINDAEGR